VENTWVHFVWLRDGSDMRVYHNGTQIGSDYTTIGDATYSFTGNDLYIGSRMWDGDHDHNQHWEGYIDEFRISKGINRTAAGQDLALTNGSFTPPTEAYSDVTIEDMTLQSVATTAEAAPTSGDIVMLIENAAGTAVLNTDIKAYVSRNGGTTFTEGTLTDEGSWGTNKKILAFHDLDISGQSSGTSMKYKITTHNQTANKETRIHAVSLAWS
jgi:hypothetical protein